MAGGIQIGSGGVAIGSSGVVVTDADDTPCCCNACAGLSQCDDPSCETLRITFPNAAPIATFLRGTTWDLVFQPRGPFVDLEEDCDWYVVSGDYPDGDWIIIWLDLANYDFKVLYQKYVGGVFDSDGSYELSEDEEDQFRCPTEALNPGWTVTCVG